ncbi:neurofilament light polypeptide-like [Elgaria multicarinata webbii]|uniref:neurofilament light polypeptide-like n=1 Tax=Elgaria multicarinata webbii TaxID=159646 RepID=UPI002FCD60BA
MDSEALGWRRPWEEYRGGGGGGGRSVRVSFFSASSSSSAGHRRSARFSAPSGPLVADPLERLDLAQVSSLNAELLGLRAQEKEQLVGLNDRFATYVERVRDLEQRNRALRLELEALRRHQRAPARLPQLYQQEVRGLRALLDAEAGDKARLEAEHDRLRQACGQLRERYAQEARRRLDAEETLRRVRQEAAQAALATSDADGAAGALRAELAFLQKLLGEERAELAAQSELAAATRVAALEGGPAAGAAKPDLSAALRDIRAQYESLAAKNMQAAEEWYRSKFASVAELASRNQDAVRTIRQETVEYRRLLQSRSAEMETLRGAIDALHKQLESLEGQQSAEVARCQERVAELEQEISEAKEEMARYLREYQELLNIKMALDIEIAAYRKLLEGEEMWWSSSWQAMAK